MGDPCNQSPGRVALIKTCLLDGLVLFTIHVPASFYCVRGVVPRGVLGYAVWG